MTRFLKAAGLAALLLKEKMTVVGSATSRLTTTRMQKKVSQLTPCRMASIQPGMPLLARVGKAESPCARAAIRARPISTSARTTVSP